MSGERHATDTGWLIGRAENGLLGTCTADEPMCPSHRCAIPITTQLLAWSMSPYSCASDVSKYLLRLKSRATCASAARANANSVVRRKHSFGGAAAQQPASG